MWSAHHGSRHDVSARAHRRTGRRLRRMERSGWKVLDLRPTPPDPLGPRLVVGRGGVFTVESRVWDRRLPVRPRGHTRLFHGPTDLSGELDALRREADRISGLLGDWLGFRVDVRASLAVHGPLIPWNVLSVRGVDIYRDRHIRSYLRRHERALTTSEVDRIARAAHIVLLPVGQPTTRPEGGVAPTGLPHPA